jgi:hypothetical protein
MTDCCGGFGVIKIQYHSGEPADYGLCRCPAGMDMRRETNPAGKRTGYALWQVWASRNQIPLDHIALIEDLLTEAELADRFGPATPAPAADAGAIAAAMRSRKARL